MITLIESLGGDLYSPLAQILEAINAAEDKDIKTSCVLSTLEEYEDHATIMVDNEISFGQCGVTLTYVVDLTEVDNTLRCSGVDPNPENVYLQFNHGKLPVEFEGILYPQGEAETETEIKELILGSKLNNLTMDTVDHLLKQILISDAVNSTTGKKD